MNPYIAQANQQSVPVYNRYLNQELTELSAQKAIIKEVRGLGLMKGIELSAPAAPYIKALQEAGILVIPSGEFVIRLLPPLILQEEDIDALMDALKRIL